MNRLEKMDVPIRFCAVPRGGSEMMDYAKKYLIDFTEMVKEKRG